MRNHLKFYSAPTGSRPSIADFTFEPFFARDFANQAFPFSACNIEKWVWPGNEASRMHVAARGGATRSKGHKLKIT